MNDIALFKEVASMFENNGFKLYLIGGSTRDYIIGREFNEYDCCTNATPDEMKQFIVNGDFTFSKYGNVNFKFQGIKFEITTFRKEENYQDARHPSQIVFVGSPQEDYKRRDFTINALYMDSNGKVFDYCDGLIDLNNKVIRMIGNPIMRLIEDPLRIMRAIRFCIELDFKLDTELQQAINETSYLLERLTPAKVNNEINKVMKVNAEKTKLFLQYFNIKEKY